MQADTVAWLAAEKVDEPDAEHDGLDGRADGTLQDAQDAQVAANARPLC